jgi:hypothetical protein
MLKHFIFPLFIISLLTGVYGCHKNGSTDSTNPNNPPINGNPPIVDKDSGTFLALVNNKEWHPTYHSAVYYPKWKQLYISASDNDQSPVLFGGINLDSVNLFKKYLLEPNGENTFRHTFYGSYYFSDHDSANAGGSFTLTKLDTVKKTMSGTLHFTGYDKSLKKMVFSSTQIEDIPIKIDYQNYNGNYGSYTIQGATTTDFKSKDIHARIGCWTSTGNSLVIGICSVMNGFPDAGRNIFFRIHLANGVKKYQLYPAYTMYTGCIDSRIVSFYRGQIFPEKYFPISGELNILSIDANKKTLDATFNVQYRDTTSKGETFTISNGKIRLNTWID